MQFVDEIEIKIMGGKGGNGVIRFSAEYGPSGGNGGDGGDIIFHATHNSNTLSHLTRYAEIQATDGKQGMGADASKGKGGEDMIIKVPIGTIVRDKTTGEIIVDLKKPGKYVIAKGGRGGRGNASFVTNQNKSPRVYEYGLPGDYLNAHIEVRVLADCGIIGFPSSGKSSFISIVSNAKPQIASYPFTTLSPVVGVIKHKNQRFIMADLPGLIEGASDGKGLGIKFLKHASRCKVLVHFISADRLEYINDYRVIRKELKEFSAELTTKPEIICLSKCDEGIIDEMFNDLEKEVGSVIKISSHTGEKVDILLNKVVEELSKIQIEEEVEEKQEEIMVIDLLENVKDLSITVRKENDAYFVEGNGAKHMILRCPLDTDDNIKRFNYLLDRKKVLKKLEKLG